MGKPGVNVSTKTAYENLKLDDPAVVHPDIYGMVTAVRNGDLDGMISRMGNVFEPGIISKYPVIQEIKDLMESNGARKAMMSGSCLLYTSRLRQKCQPAYRKDFLCR